jgi:integrase/recombinase XerD
MRRSLVATYGNYGSTCLLLLSIPRDNVRSIRMRLIAASEDFQIGGMSKPGFPILLDENMNSSCEANEFLRYYLMRGAIGSTKSWEPIGQAMYDFFGFLEAHNLQWDDVSRGEEKNLVAAYRDYCFEYAGLARSTVRLRLVYICEFYKYAQRQGWVQSLPYEFEIRHITRAGGFFAHLDASGGTVSAISVMPRKHRGLIKFLTTDQVKALLTSVHNPHHRMMIRCALQTGMRREELATFPIAYVFDPDRVGIHGRNVRVTLDPYDGTGMQTKGRKKRDIWVTRKVLQDLHHYAVHWRGERASLSDADPKPLFLNQAGQPWANTGKGIEAMVVNAGAKIGLVVHPHMLRHTYATHTLVAMQRHRGDNRIEPLVFVQKQLGHASIQSTMAYLHIVNELADEAVLQYDDELNDWAEAQS